jgi:hypothetical protein
MTTGPTALVDLDAAPAIPGGGPASTRRLARITHPGFRAWCVVLLAWTGVTGAVLVAWARSGSLSAVGDVLFVACGVLGCVVLVAGIALPFFVAESRVDDDMTAYARGTEVTLSLGGYADEATVAVRGGVVARLAPPVLEGRRSLWVGDEELTLCRRGARTTLEGTDGVQAEIVAHSHGDLTDHEFAVDGRLLRMRRRTGSTVPRATLLDDHGRAWAVTFGRRRITVRLPDEVHTGGAAFCLFGLAVLAGDVGAAAGPVQAPTPRRRRGRKRPDRA